ncbi:FtsX-like permease family protein [Phytohabitans flavus]|uniref:FtsX-like permease family protein n=1 Tax=Phytohabitans flavus TaxID=1076124 RepID=UPI00363697CC
MARPGPGRRAWPHGRRGRWRPGADDAASGHDDRCHPHGPGLHCRLAGAAAGGAHPPRPTERAIRGSTALPLRRRGGAGALRRRGDRAAAGGGAGLSRRPGVRGPPHPRPRPWRRGAGVAGPGAPDSVADRLREQGLATFADDSIGSALDQYGEQGPPLALRFQLLAGALGVLLAALALAVAAAVERPDRSAELSALRAQGLSLRAVRLIAYGGYAVLVLAGVVIGIAAAALGGTLVEAAVPVFVDDWAVLPVPTGPQAPALLVAALGGLVVLGATGAVAAGQLVRATGGRT